MDWIIFSLYRYFLLPLAFGIIRILSFLKLQNKFFETVQFRLKNEFYFKPSYQSSKQSIGIHAASGEIEYAFPLIRKLKQAHPEYNIIVTLSSTSVLKSALNQPEIDAVGPAPLDLLWTVGSFLKQFKFKLYLFARTDVWPEISYQLHHRGIPTYLFSATFSKVGIAESSALSVLYSPLYSLTRTSLNFLTKIFTVSEEDKKNLYSIQVNTSIECLGDTRYDQVLHKKNNPTTTLPILKSPKLIFVAGSTWPEDERILLPAMVNAVDQWSFVIAPHEITATAIQKLESFFTYHKLKTRRLSKATSDPWDVLIVDQYGYLFYLYQFASFTFVGGSFRSKVHSVMEPLSYYKPVCVGPFHSNNREAIEFSKIPMSQFPSAWVQSINTPEELLSLLDNHATISEQNRAQMASELKIMMNHRLGATLRTYDQIYSHL